MDMDDIRNAIARIHEEFQIIHANCNPMEALVAESILETLTTARKQIARFAEALEARA